MNLARFLLISILLFVVDIIVMLKNYDYEKNLRVVQYEKISLLQKAQEYKYLKNKYKSCNLNIQAQISHQGTKTIIYFQDPPKIANQKLKTILNSYVKIDKINIKKNQKQLEVTVECLN